VPHVFGSKLQHYFWGYGKNPMDGGGDGAWSFPHPTNRCISLLPHLGYNNQPRVLATSVIITGLSLPKFVWKAIREEHREILWKGGTVTHGGRCEGGPCMWLVNVTWAYSTDQSICELRFLEWQIFRFWSSELWRHVVWPMVTNILEEIRGFTGSPKK